MQRHGHCRTTAWPGLRIGICTADAIRIEDTGETVVAFWLQMLANMATFCGVYSTFFDLYHVLRNVLHKVSDLEAFADCIPYFRGLNLPRRASAVVRAERRTLSRYKSKRQSVRYSSCRTASSLPYSLTGSPPKLRLSVIARAASMSKSSEQNTPSDLSKRSPALR